MRNRWLELAFGLLAFAAPGSALPGPAPQEPAVTGTALQEPAISGTPRQEPAISRPETLAPAHPSGSTAPATPPAAFDLSGATVGQWMKDPLGLTLVVHHPASAFPDGTLSRTGVTREVVRYKRIHGRRVKQKHLEVVAPPEVFRDDRTLIFIPDTLRFDAPLQLLVYFHGWRGTVTGPSPTAEAQHLRETLRYAGGNTVLIMPQGPYNYPSSRFGNLETVAGLTRFLTGIIPVLPMAGMPEIDWRTQVHRIVLAGHSGGGAPITRILEDGAARGLDTGGAEAGKEASGQADAAAGDMTGSVADAAAGDKAGDMAGSVAGGDADALCVWRKMDTIVLLDATYNGEKALRSWWQAAAGRTLRSYYLLGTATAPVSTALAGLRDAWPERVEQLEIEGIDAAGMPEALRPDAHFAIPWYRLWRGLGGAAGCCRWAEPPPTTVPPPVTPGHTAE